MLTESVIVATSFIIFVAVIYKPTKKMILNFLDHKVQEAIRDIENATKLRQEAENYYKLAQTNLDDAKQTAQEIINRAQERANLILSNIEEEVKIIAEKRFDDSIARIAQQEMEIVNELKSEAVELAMTYVQDVLLHELDKGAQMNLIENTLVKNKRILH